MIAGAHSYPNDYSACLAQQEASRKGPGKLAVEQRWKTGGPQPNRALADAISVNDLTTDILNQETNSN